MPAAPPSLPAPAADAQPLHLQLLGSPRWSTPAGAQALLSRTDAALLALVALPGVAPRDRVATWLWPAASVKAANSNLRQHLFKLRQTSGHPVLESGALLRLAAGVVVDRAQAPLPEGELLGGFDYGDSQDLDAWVAAERDRLRLERADALAARAAELESQGALAAAIDVATRVLELAPTLEHAWRRLMRLHYLRGDRSAAVAAFERFEQAVCREYGLTPSAETLELLRTVENAAAQRLPRSGPLPAVLLRPPHLVGRDDAWRAVQAAWAAGRAVLLLGEGGIGKTRLLTELLAAEPAGLAASLAGQARPGDAAMPYAVWTPLLVAATARYTAAQGLAAHERDELAHLLPALGTPGSPAARQALLWRAVESLLAGCHAHGLTVLSLDDLHLADPASLELTRWLVASPRLHGLRWLLAARPGEPGPAGPLLAQWLGDSSRIEAVRLGPLVAGDVLALLRSLNLTLPLDERAARAGVAGDGDHQAWAERLFRHAGGQPFYTLETLKAVLLFGPVDSRAPLPLTQSAAAMIDRRMAPLSPLALSLLRSVALAPGLLTLPLAAQLVAQPLEQTSQAWAELEQMQLARGAYPAHDLVREQVLAAWPEAARAVQARALAQALQAQPVDPARRATLWLQAQEFSAAATNFEQAARAAGRAGRLAEQVDLFERAVDAWRLAHDAPSAFAAELQAWNVTLVLRGSRVVLEGIEPLLARADSDQARAQVLTLRANAFLNEARYAEALADSAAALHHAPRGGALAREAATLHGRALALTGRGAEALQELTAACDAAAAAGDDAQSLVALGALAHALQVAGRLGDAQQTQQQARDVAFRLGDATSVAQASCNLATLQSVCGLPLLAWRSARDADRRLEALGARDAHWVYNRITLARCAAHLGHLDEAAAVLDAIHEPAAVVGAAMATMVAVIRFGVDDWLGVGRREQLPPPEQAGSPLSAAGLLLAQHRCLREGPMAQSADTRAELRQLEQRLQQLAHSHPALREDPVLARDWCRLGPAADAVPHLERLAQRAREAGAPGLARSLDVVRVERLLECDVAAAAALADVLAQGLAEGLHPATWPPQAWSVLAAARLAGGAPRDAQACRQQGQAWLAAARLPPAVARATFESRHRRLQLRADPDGGHNANQTGGFL